MTTLKIGFALVGLSAAFSSPAFAENCRALPQGPERRACAMREHPGMFEAREAKKNNDASNSLRSAASRTKPVQARAV
jgi:hypothetical protein